MELRGSLTELTRGLEFVPVADLLEYIAEHIPYGRTTLLAHQRNWPFDDPVYIEQLRKRHNDDRTFGSFFEFSKNWDVKKAEDALLAGLRAWGRRGEFIAFGRRQKLASHELLPRSFWAFATFDRDNSSATAEDATYVDLHFVLTEMIPLAHPLLGEIARVNAPPGQQRRGSPAAGPGRPSLMPAVVKEFERRAQARLLERTARAEARALADWCLKTHGASGAPCPSAKTIENKIGPLHRDAVGQKRRESPSA